MGDDIILKHVIKHYDAKTPLPKGSVLYIHGPPKSGKTEMVHSVVNYLLQLKIKNMQAPRSFDWIQKYRQQFQQYICFYKDLCYVADVDADKVNVIEDIRLPTRMDETGMIETVKNHGGIIIITSTKSPDKIDILSPHITHHIKLTELF